MRCLTAQPGRHRAGRIRKIVYKRRGLDKSRNACQKDMEIGKGFGEVGIRTLDSLTTITVFETAAFDHSATSPVFGNPRF
jgi:hypothetical protein